MNTKPNDRLILFALWMLVFSASSQLMIIVAMLPIIGEQLAIPENQRGILVSAYAIMVGVFALVIGPVSDRFGRRRVLLVGTALMTVALSLHTVADSFLALLTVRALAGIAGGVLSGATVSYVGDYFPYERRGWANGWVMSGIALGQILGVPMGTVLAQAYGFRTPFLIFAVTMLATFVLVWQFVPQPDVELSKEKLSFGGALKGYQKLLKRGEVRVAAAVFALMFFSMAMYVTYLPAWLGAELNVSANEIAALFFAGGIASVIAGPTAGRISDRIGRKTLILGSTAGFAAVMALLTFVVGNFWVACVLFFVVSILNSARMSPFQALLSALVSGKHRGALMSLTVSLGQVGFALGAAVAGFGYANFGYASNTFAGAAVALFVAVLVWQFLPEPEGGEHVSVGEQSSLVNEVDCAPIPTGSR